MCLAEAWTLSGENPNDATYAWQMLEHLVVGILMEQHVPGRALNIQWWEF